MTLWGLNHGILSDIKRSSCLFFVGSYSDNEVQPDHAIIHFMEMFSSFYVPIRVALDDTVKEAAYGTIVSDERNTYHPAIGMALYSTTTPNDIIDEALSLVVDQLNHGVLSQIQSPTQQLEISKLNIQTGMRLRKPVVQESKQLGHLSSLTRKVLETFAIHHKSIDDNHKASTLFQQARQCYTEYGSQMNACLAVQVSFVRIVD
eukprot:scaffold1771_cov211-Alexandrium_tamarense.AAC.18